MNENPLYEEAEATEATVKAPKAKTAKSETPLDRLLTLIASKVEIPEVLLEVPSNSASLLMLLNSKFAHGERMLEKTPSMGWIPQNLALTSLAIRRSES